MTQEKEKLPNDKLAELIVEKLKNEDLISKDKLDELQNKLALGTARQEDWRLWVELNLPDLTGGKKDE